MPRIPLADIPNAPSLGRPMLTDPPRFRVDHSGSARQMQQNELNPDTFNGSARAMENVGEAIGKAAKPVLKGTMRIFGELAKHMQNSRDQADLSRAEGIMEKARGDHATEITSLPESQWVPLWETKYRPQIEAGLDTLKAAPPVRASIDRQLVRFDAATRTNTAYRAHQATLEGDKTAILSGITHARDQHNYEAALTGIDRLLAGGHATPEQGDLMRTQLHADMQTQTIRQMVGENPRATAALLAGDVQKGSSEHFSAIPIRQLRQLSQWAEKETLTREVSTHYGLQQAIARGDIPDETQLRQAAGHFLTEESIQSLSTYLDHDAPFTGDTWSGILTDVRAFQPTRHSDIAEYHALQQRIMSTVPKSMQADVSREVYEAWQARDTAPKDPASLRRQQAAGLFTRVDTMARNGSLGSTGRDSAGNLVDPDQAHTLGMKAVFLKSEMERFLQKNPEASPTEIDQFLEDQLIVGGLRSSVGKGYQNFRSGGNNR